MSIQRIQLRHGTATEWTTANPILLQGEVGLESDTLKQKWGDGTSHWADLSYSGGGAAVNYADDEEPSGAKDGSNQHYTLANEPVGGFELFYNGQRLTKDVDFTQSGAAFVYIEISPASDDVHVCKYRY